MDAEVPAVEPALAVGERIGGRAHFAEILVGAQVQLADQLKIVVQHLVEIAALLLRLGVDHRQMQADRADVEAADEDRLVLVIRGLHAPALKPRREKRAAAHRRNDLAVALVDARHIAVAREREPVGVHRALRAVHARLEDVLQLPALAVQVFVVEEDQLREKHRLLAPLLALSAATDGEDRLRRHLCKAVAAEAEGHGDERIVAAAGRHGVELVFPALEALMKVVCKVLYRLFLTARLVKAERAVLLHILVVAARGVLRQNLVRLGHGEAAVLLAGRAEHNVADDVKRDIERLRLVVPEVAHLKAALQHRRHIEEAAVHRVAARGHVVDVDIAVAAGL